MKFETSTLQASWDEAAGLITANVSESGIPALNAQPNRGAYEILERRDELAVFVARASDGAMAGYALFVLGESPQYVGVRIAFQEVVYVSPALRGFVSGKFLLWMDAQLKATGVRLIQRTSSMAQPHERSLERMGYKRHAVIFLKEV